MAHFAQINDDSVVIQVIVVHNNELLVDGVESEAKGIEFCQSLFGGNWVQTSYNGNFRKNYAAIGYLYDPIKDAFIPPKPFESWSLNEDNYQWDPPIPYPTDGNVYFWNETEQIWDVNG